MSVTCAINHKGTSFEIALSIVRCCKGVTSVLWLYYWQPKLLSTHYYKSTNKTYF